MKAIILAAGEGTRLRPYTNDRPKCMVQFADRPLLHWQLRALRSVGLKDITIVGGYLADQLDAPGTDLVLNSKFASTNMVATLFCAADKMLPGEDLLICYGDIIYEEKVLEAVLAGSAEINLAADREWQKLWSLRMEDPLSDAETFRMDSDYSVLELGKKPSCYDQIQAQYIGLIRVRGDQVSRFIEAYRGLDRGRHYDGKDFDNMYMTSFLQHLINSGWDVKASLIDNGWLEVDTAEELECYSEMIGDEAFKNIFNISLYDDE